MGPELLNPHKKRAGIIKLGMIQGEPKMMQDAENAALEIRGGPTQFNGQSGIDAQTNRHRLAMFQVPIRQAFEAVRRPMPVIQRTRNFIFERITPLDDVTPMEFCTADDGALRFRLRTPRNRTSVLFQTFKFARIFQEGDFDRFTESTSPVPIGK